MGARDISLILAVILTICTMALLVVTKRIRNGLMCWMAIPVVMFLWYCVLVCLWMAYYMWRVNGVL